MSDRATVESSIDTLLADNSSGDISAEDVRDVLHEIVSSTVFPTDDLTAWQKAAEIAAKTGDYTVTTADAGRPLIANKATAIEFALPAVASNANELYIVRNIGVGDLTINPNSTEQIEGATTRVYKTGEGAIIYKNEGKTAWRTFDFGKGALKENNLSDLASIPSARANLGIPATLPSVITSGGHTAIAADRGKVQRFSTAAQTVALTAAATLGDGWYMDIVATDKTVTIDPNSTETIDGASVLIVPPGRSVRVWCDGAAFATSRAHAHAWELIGTSALSSVASWSQTDLSAYRSLRIRGYLRPATNSVAIYLRMDANNGASFDAGGTDYGYSLIWGTPSPAISAFGDYTEGFISLSSSFGVGNSAGHGLAFDLNIENFNQAAYTYAHGTQLTLASGTNMQFGTIHGFHWAAAALNALQIIASSGNIADGWIVLEGIRG